MRGPAVTRLPPPGVSRVDPRRHGREPSPDETACPPDAESLGASYGAEPLGVDSNQVSAHARPDRPGIRAEFLRRPEECPGKRYRALYGLARIPRFPAACPLLGVRQAGIQGQRPIGDMGVPNDRG